MPYTQQGVRDHHWGDMVKSMAEEVIDTWGEPSTVLLGEYVVRMSLKCYVYNHRLMQSHMACQSTETK